MYVGAGAQPARRRRSGGRSWAGECPLRSASAASSSELWLGAKNSDTAARHVLGETGIGTTKIPTACLLVKCTYLKTHALDSNIRKIHVIMPYLGRCHNVMLEVVCEAAADHVTGLVIPSPLPRTFVSPSVIMCNNHRVTEFN